MLNKINEIVSTPFNSEEELLQFYQKVLPGRIANFRLDEVGPIMSVGSPEEVEGYLNNRFYFNGVGVDMGKDIDWYTAVDGDLEWNGGFVRQGYFMYLADYYTKTGDEKYAKTIIEHMLDYIAKVPPYNPEGQLYLDYKKSTWRPFEAAGRVSENWPVALKQIINSKSMTAEAFAKIFYSIYEHAVFLSKYHWRTGNHACLEAAGLGVISIFYKELKMADEWRKYTIDFLMTMFDEQFHKDGYTKEMSGAYHWIALRNFFALYQVGVNNGYQDIFPAKYVSVIKKAGEAEFYQQKPDYSLPVTNDSNVTTIHKHKLEELTYLMDNEFLKYRLSNEKEGKKPPHTSYFFEDARLGIMRSNWTEDAVYASFDMGRWGDNHMNEDQLNLELSAYGRNLFVNCGRWRYTTSPGIDWLEKAKYFKTTMAYNSVICENYGQMPLDANGSMIIADNYDYAQGIFDGGYGKESDITDQALLKERGVVGGKELILDNTTHKREVFFAKPDFFVVKDTIASDKAKTATQIWHMAEGDVNVKENYAYSTFEDANFIMLQLSAAKLDVYKGSEEPLKGWNCPKYDYLVEAPELNYTASGDGEILFETFIFPIKGKVDESNMPKVEKSVNADATIYTVVFNGKTTKISAGDCWKTL